MREVTFDQALLAIEHEEGVVLLITADTAPSRVMRARVAAASGLLSARGYTALCLPRHEDNAIHPELAAVRFPQIRVFTNGEETKRLTGLQDEDVLNNLV